VCNVLQIAGDFTENKDGSIDNLTVYALWVSTCLQLTSSMLTSLQVIDGIAYALMPLLLAIVALFVECALSRTRDPGPLLTRA
jgi:hypothetical protein